MTPDELSRALADVGRNVPTRTLKDWRRRGLLPPLSKRSRGRAQGIERRWSSPHVFDRACVAHQLLNRLEIVDEALFGLASAGYFVNPETLRKAWLSRLDRKNRQLASAATRKEDGVDGLMPAAPPKKLYAAQNDKLNLRGLAQLFWELRRVHISGEHIGNDEAFGLVEDAARSLQINATEEVILGWAEQGIDILQALVNRDLEHEIVSGAPKIEFKVAQISLNRFYRVMGNLGAASGIESTSSPVAITIHAIADGPLLLKLAFLLAEIGPLQELVLGLRHFERWSRRANFIPTQEGQLVSTPTKRTQADLRRTCRTVFGDW